MKGVAQGEKATSLFPPGIDEIPAFSMLEVVGASKCGDPVINHQGELAQRTSAFRFVSINLLQHSLYSYTDILPTLAHSMEKSKQQVMRKKEEFPCISKDLEGGDVIFHIGSVDSSAVLSEHALEEFDMVSITNWSKDPVDSSINIDIPVSLLLKHTNSNSVQWSMTLLELAINMKCLSLLVTTSEYFRKGDVLSHFRAVPLIDTLKMFSA
eukprot:2576001-Rhodomonas_salina.1